MITKNSIIHVLNAGVYLSLNGTLMGNESYVNITAIGEGEAEALLCLTDLYQFTNTDSERVGNWYFPNQSVVATTGDIYIKRGLGFVSLNRNNSVTMPTGLFRCEILDANRTKQNIYIEVNLNVSTTEVNLDVSTTEVNNNVSTTEVNHDDSTADVVPSPLNVSVITVVVVGGLLIIIAGAVLILAVIIR